MCCFNIEIRTHKCKDLDFLITCSNKKNEELHREITDYRAGYGESRINMEHFSVLGSKEI